MCPFVANPGSIHHLGYTPDILAYQYHPLHIVTPFLLMLGAPPNSTLFPYTTLFRSSFPLAASTAPFLALAILFAFSLALANKIRSEEHTSELQSRSELVCRLLLEKKNILGILSTPETLNFSDSVHGLTWPIFPYVLH